ncbi:phospholipase D-like domain-containing protein [Allorhodopirellula solitaria]|uniref:hypothetical protein n=1 Tax=Allorhodopirellula solitaria TaxID=2527987 RepID=UPI0011B7301D|nr:hypothetical protein [Allorhodopirellula solitaria]
MPLLVSSEDNEVIGLPPDWEDLLVEEVIRVAKEKAASYSEGDRKADSEWFNACVRPRIRPMLGRRRFNASLEETGTVSETTKENSEEKASEGSWVHTCRKPSLLSSSEAHQQHLKQCFEKASTSIILSTSEVNSSAIRQLMPLMTRALARGVNIDVIWSINDQKRTQPNIRDGLALLRRMESASKGNSLAGRLMMCGSISQLHTSIVISDRDGKIDFAVGSYRWLGGQDAFSGTSVIFDDPIIVSKVCQFVSRRMQLDDNLRQSRNRLLLDHAGSRLERQDTKPEPPIGRAMVLYGREHFAFKKHITELSGEEFYLEVGAISSANLEELHGLVERLSGSEVCSLWIKYESTTVDLSVFHDRQDKLRIQFEQLKSDGSFNLRMGATSVYTSFDWIESKKIPKWDDDVHVGLVFETF